MTDAPPPPAAPPGPRPPAPPAARLGAAAVELAAGFGAACVAVALLWARQERIVWQPPVMWPGHDRAPAGARRLDYRADDGQPLLAWVVDPPGHPPDAPAPLLLAFHGNAELAAWTVPWALEAARRNGRRVVVPEYRGYAGLPGAVGYAGSQLDARAAWRAARALAHAPGDVALFGHSLGSAVAAELAGWAADRGEPPRALLLQSPFTSVRAMTRVLAGARAEGWWRRVARVHFDTEARVAALDVPVSVAHGARDLVIPVRMGQAVHAAARRPGALLVVPRAGHNDVPQAGGAAYHDWLARALAPAAGHRGA